MSCVLNIFHFCFWFTNSWQYMWLNSEHWKYFKNEGNIFLMKTLITLCLSNEIIRNYSFNFCLKMAFLSSAYKDVQGHVTVNKGEWL